MPVMRRIAVSVCGLAAALLAVTGCGEPGTRHASTSSTSAWMIYQADVTGVTPGPGPMAVTVHVKVLAGRDGCSRQVRVGYHEEANGVVYANIVQESARAATPGGCPTFRADAVRLTSTAPIGSRQLSLNQQLWALTNGAYTACDHDLGCDPPKNRCDPIWTRAAVRGLDVSRHSQGTVEACDGRWLIMTVPDDPAMCGAEARPGCQVNSAVRRYFLRNQPSGWLLIAATTSAGCDAVLKAAPDFPRGLCAGLAPTSRLTYTAPALPSR